MLAAEALELLLASIFPGLSSLLRFLAALALALALEHAGSGSGAVGLLHLNQVVNVRFHEADWIVGVVPHGAFTHKVHYVGLLKAGLNDAGERVVGGHFGVRLGCFIPDRLLGWQADPLHEPIALYDRGLGHANAELGLDSDSRVILVGLRQECLHHNFLITKIATIGVVQLLVGATNVDRLKVDLSSASYCSCSASCRSHLN